MARMGLDSDAVRLRDALLDRSWQLIDLLERLGQGPAHRLLTERREAEVAVARDKLEPLLKWPSLPATSYETYRSANNHVRVARVLDFVEPGDRILDVGIGYGYVTSALMRSGRPSYYCGFDLTQRFVEATRQGLAVNGIPAGDVHLEIGDLFHLSAPWVHGHRPDLVLLLEVLEHVDDAELAFETLGRVLDGGTSVLFTVPMLGRLEGVMGHRSVFDRDRLEHLCERGGLTIQYVEPLHNTWTLVLATTSPEIPSRVFAGAGITTPATPGSLEHDYVLRDVDLHGSSLDYRRLGRPKRGRTRVRASRAGVRAEIEAMPGQPAPYYGGVAFPVTAPGILRMQVEYDNPDDLTAVYVEGYEGTERVARWKWTLGADVPAPGQRIVHLLKPTGGGRFVTVGRIEAERIERIEVYVELKEHVQNASFTLRRASFAPLTEAGGAYSAPSSS